MADWWHRYGKDARDWALFASALAGLGVVLWRAFRAKPGDVERASSRRTRTVPTCPGCGYDIRAGEERCGDCGLPILAALWLDMEKLGDDWPAGEMAPRPMPRGEVAVTLLATDRPYEALALRNQLVARGVRAEIRYATAGQPVDEFVEDGTVVHVVVCADDLPTARAYLNSFTVRLPDEPVDPADGPRVLRYRRPHPRAWR